MTNKRHWKTCEKLSDALGISKQECNCAYARWLEAGLVQGILDRDPVTCALALKFDWFGKQRPISVPLEKTYKDRDTMNDFERLIDDAKLMAWAVSKIGSTDRAQKALDRLK